MTSARRRAALVATIATVLTGSLVGCTAGSSGVAPTSAGAAPSASATRTAPAPAATRLGPTLVPTPSAAAAAVHPPAASATVLDTAAPVAALEASRAVFASAPVVVVASGDDGRAQLTAASVAVGLGAPVLLTGPGGTAADVAAEVRRLGAHDVVLVGAAVAPGTGARTVALAAGADAAAIQAATGVDLGAARVVGKTGAERADAVAALSGAQPAVLLDRKPAPAPSGGGSASPSSAPSGPLGVPPRPAIGVVALVGPDAPLAALATLRAAGVPVLPCPTGDPRTSSASVLAIAAAKPDAVVALGAGFGSADVLATRVASARTGVQLPGGGQLVFPEGDGVRAKRYVALYGTPGSKALGVLGEQSVPKTLTRAASTAKKYSGLTKDTVVPMVEIIATIAAGSAGKDGDYSRERSVAELRPLVEAASAKGLAVVLDLQPGRADFLSQAKRYSTLLAMPNVGLALDPEWRLTKKQLPLHQIGSVKVSEVNKVSDWLATFTRDRHLPQKVFVLHQFSLAMIKDRAELDTSHDELATVIHVDGQGSQPAKAGTWKALRAGAPDVHWGWKNFYDEDKPMLSPKKTYAISPKPDLVTYQ